MWKDDKPFSRPFATTKAKYITGRDLLDLSHYLQPPTTTPPHWDQLPNKIDDRCNIVGLSFGNDINNYSKRIKSSWFGNGGYHERTSRSLLHYVASLYRNSDMATCEQLQEVWVPLPANPAVHPEDSKYDYADLITIFAYARHVHFFSTHDEASGAIAAPYIRDVIQRAYTDSFSRAVIHIDTAKNRHMLVPYLTPSSFSTTMWKQRAIVPATPYQGFKHTPWFSSLNSDNQSGVERFYKFLYENPQTGIVASDFDGTIYRENHSVDKGLNDIPYTHYLSVHDAYIIKIAKDLLRKYPDTFPAFQPEWMPPLFDEDLEQQWWKEYTHNVLFTEFVQERRLNDAKLTGGQPVSPDQIGQTPPTTKRFFKGETSGTPRNATMPETCHMLATIWQGRKAEGPSEAYEEVFRTSPELRNGMYAPVEAMLNAATNTFHNKVTVITLAFPDFVRWFLGKHGLFLPVIGNRAEERGNIFTDRHDRSLFETHPDYPTHSHKFVVDELGKAQILEHYFKDHNLKPKVFFGNSDGDYPACEYTLKQGGIAVLINPRGSNLLKLTQPDYEYRERVIVLWDLPYAISRPA